MFKRRALALVEDLCQEFGEFEVEYNTSAPRRGSFEINLKQDDKNSKNLLKPVFLSFLKLSLAKNYWCAQ